MSKSPVKQQIKGQKAVQQYMLVSCARRAKQKKKEKKDKKRSRKIEEDEIG
jgi:hypothetical protein